MLTFKDYLLLESDDKIAYHLAKNPQHADFLNRYLSDDHTQRNNRSKYLDWVVKGFNKPLKDGQNPIDPEHLGSQIDYFHSAKSKKGFDLHKDINKYSTHHDLINSMETHKKELPISDKETTYSHPDNTVTYNDKGVKITKLGSEKAAQHTRDHFENSWCVTQPGHCAFNSYKNLHLIETRNPTSGKIDRYMAGHYAHEDDVDWDGNPIIPETDFKDEKDLDPNIDSIHDHTRQQLFHNGPEGIKGHYKFADDKHIKQYIDDIKSEAYNPQKLGLYAHLAKHFPESHQNLYDHILSNDQIYKDHFSERGKEDSGTEQENDHKNAIIYELNSNPKIINQELNNDNPPSEFFKEQHSSLLYDRKDDRINNMAPIAKKLIYKMGHQLSYYAQHVITGGLKEQDKTLDYDTYDHFLTQKSKHINDDEDSSYNNRVHSDFLHHIAKTDPLHYDKIVPLIAKSGEPHTYSKTLNHITSDPTFPHDDILKMGLENLPAKTLLNMARRNKDSEKKVLDYYHNKNDNQYNKRDMEIEFAKHKRYRHILENKWNNDPEIRLHDTMIEYLKHTDNEKYVNQRILHLLDKDNYGHRYFIKAIKDNFKLSHLAKQFEQKGGGISKIKLPGKKILNNFFGF